MRLLLSWWSPFRERLGESECAPSCEQIEHARSHDFSGEHIS
jgi:hypothetical protein